MQSNPKKRRLEHIVRRALTGAMIVAGIVWILYTPYDPDAVWRALPADAQYFSRHKNAAARFVAFVHNPLTVTVLRSAGIDPADLRAHKDDPVTERWVRRLFGKDLVLAYVPDPAGGGGPAWVFASWIGNRSQRLRWSLSLWGIPGLSAVSEHGGTKIWRMEDADLEEGLNVFFALADGLLLGAIARDPVAVRMLLATWNKQPGYHSLSETARRRNAENMAGEKAQDWGAYTLRRPAGPEDVPLAFFPVLYSLEPLSVAGKLAGNFIVSEDKHAGGLPPLEGIKVLLGEAPVFWAFASPVLLSFLSRQPEAPRWVTVLERALFEPVEQGTPFGGAADSGDKGIATAGYPLFVSVLDESYAGYISGGGRRGLAWLRGLRVPAVMAGLYVADETTADAVLMNILDELNREYRLGLIPRRVPRENLTVIENTRSGNSFYDRLQMQERVGVIYRDGWLLFAGQAGVFDQLTSDRNGLAGESVSRAWLPDKTKDSTAAYCWADLNAFGAQTKNALAAVALMLLIGDPHGSFEMRQNLAEIKAWIEGLRAFEYGRVWIAGMDTPFYLLFNLSRQAATGMRNGFDEER